MESDAVTRAPSEGLKLSGLAGRSILLKAGSPETRGAYPSDPGTPLTILGRLWAKRLIQ